MPEEEKKEKKVTPFFFSKKTQAKKESFTFSDKIKNSKPASSKSFASRASSKIGSDGKPRQTLFERTKRDAPFFIAALVALLLLPFLYKYSGNVDENPALVTPTYEDSAFNPERSGFDSFAGDPEGQIAQLAGRDSMSLILPFGGAKNTEEEEYDEDYSRNAYNDQASSASHSLSEQDEEENITNIYKYRKKAPAATRAAFKRTATKVNRLGNAGRAGAPGSKLGVGMWGGGMKAAANKVPNQAPQSAPKPVSLQPLQAAGKPSRSYFGQAPAREAARSKDAMSKANAMQALMDAQMKPVEPGKIGGVFGGDFGGPGGGNGDLKREFAYSGKEPWWWDMMKQRSMMEWQKNFEFKWSLINWATDLLKNIFGGVINCLITGKDNGEMGHMFGYGSGGGKKAECCGKKADWVKANYKDQWASAGEDLEKACGFIKDELRQKLNKPGCGYRGGDAAGEKASFWGARLGCLGIRGGRDKSNDGVVTEENDCYTFYQTGYYKAGVGGKNRTLYHYIVGVPFDKVEAFSKASSNDERYDMLQIAYFKKGDSFSVNSANALQEVNQRKFMPLFIESVAIKNSKVGKKTSGKDTYGFEEVEDDQETFLSGNNNKIGLTYKEFLKKLGKGGIVITSDQTTDPDATMLSAKGSKKGKGWSTGARCAYPLAFVSCHNNAWAVEKVATSSGETVNGYMVAFLKLPNITANNSQAVPSQNVLDWIKSHFMVTHIIQSGDQKEAAKNVNINNIHNSNKNYDDSSVIDDVGTPFSPKQSTYTVYAQKDSSAKDKEPITITWEVRQHYNPEEPWAPLGTIANGKNGGVTNGQIVSTATCVYGADGVAGMVPGDECPQGADTNEACCKKARGQDWVYQNGKCVQPVDPQKKLNVKEGMPPNPEMELTCLAKQLVWVPKTYTERNVATPNTCDDKTFPGPKIITGTTPDHCASDMGVEIIDSKDATDFVKRVVAAYNKENSKKPISFTAQYPTMGEFVDALHIADQMNIELDKAPKEGVCLMARHVVRRSRDPHSINFKTSAGGAFQNELGAYLAYVHTDSAYYPDVYYGSATDCDKRFLALNKGVCLKNPNIDGKKQYHHTNYAWGGNTTQYETSLTKLGILTNDMRYPLRELVDGNLSTLGKCSAACYEQRKKYKEKFGFLWGDAPCPTGNMSVANALQYITGVCKVGLNAKPYGSPGSSTGSSNAPGRGSSDGQVR